jgi:multidrug efflux pump subunit AcrA (membrane-fusion protein)
MDFGPLIDDEDDLDMTPMPPMMHVRRRPRWLPWLIVALLILLIGGGVLAFLRNSHAPPVQYTQAAATVGNLTVTVAGSGPIAPNAIYDLNFSGSAPITAIYVKVGDRVTKGQKLAALDPTTLQDAVNQAQNTVNAAETSLSQAQTNLNNAKTQQSTSLNIAQLNEQKALAACVPAASSTPSTSSSASGTPVPTPTPNVDATQTAADATQTAESTCEQLARQQYTQAQQQAGSSVTTANNQVTSAQQQLNNAETALQTAEDNLKNDVLVAPHAGLVEAINGLVGETSGSGGSSGGSSSGSGSSSALIVLVDDSALSIQASVSEADIASIQVNQPATFTVAAYPSQTFRATVTSVDTLGASSSSVVTYTVDLAVDAQSLNGAHIYPGMTATTSITTAERISTLLIPSSALTFSTTALQNGEITRSQLSSLVSSGSSGSTGASGSRGIVIELKNGHLVPVLVTKGLTNGQETEILSGLNEGDQVVIAQTGGASTATPSTGSGRGGFGGNGGNFNGGGGGNTIIVPKGGN